MTPAAGLIAVAAMACMTMAAPNAVAVAPEVGVVGVHADEGRVNRPERLIASVTDTAGDPVAGATVTFTVSGRNPASGSETTGSTGRVAFVYSTSRVGRDHVTATAGGVSGRTTAIISHADSTPTEYVKSPAAGVVDVGIRSRPDLAGRPVAIYLLDARGNRKRVAGTVLRSNGTGAYEFTSQRAGRVMTFEVRVVPTSADDYHQFFSAPLTATVS